MVEKIHCLKTPALLLLHLHATGRPDNVYQHQLDSELCFQLLDLFPGEVRVITSKVTIGSSLDVPLATTHQVQVTSN